MMVNSSFPGDSLLHPNHSSVTPDHLFDLYCIVTEPTSFIFTAYSIALLILLAPLYTFILCHGLQQWWRVHSTSSGATMSHSDCFTYHMVTMELIGVFGHIVSCSGSFADQYEVVNTGICFYTFSWYGKTLFHALTCVERYLAVVHPITYMKLRNESWIRIRNISIGCVWLLCVSLMGFVMKNIFVIMDVCVLTLCLILVSFCSLSALCILNHPGPGEQGRNRERVDQSKQRAFYTIAVILGVLLLKFVGAVLWEVGYVFKTRNCILFVSDLLFNLPSSLVLPLLFLHRGGKLTSCLAIWRGKSDKSDRNTDLPHQCQ